MVVYLKLDSSLRIYEVDDHKSVNALNECWKYVNNPVYPNQTIFWVAEGSFVKVFNHENGLLNEKKIATKSDDAPRHDYNHNKYYNRFQLKFIDLKSYRKSIYNSKTHEEEVEIKDKLNSDEDEIQTGSYEPSILGILIPFWTNSRKDIH